MAETDWDMEQEHGDWGAEDDDSDWGSFWSDVRDVADPIISGPGAVLKNIKSGPAVTNLAAAGGLIIEFRNPRKLAGPIIFPSFLTAFSDRVTANFTDTNVYARMDPIYSYQNTTREITFTFDVVAYDVKEASNNLKKIKMLQNLLYPTFVGTGGGVQVMTTPPFFQIKIGNLIEDEGGTNGFLLGVVDVFDYSPDFGPGMFTVAGNYLPKAYSINCTFKPVHSRQRGFEHADATAAVSAANAIKDRTEAEETIDRIQGTFDPDSGIQVFAAGWDDLTGGADIESNGATNEITKVQADTSIFDAPPGMSW